MSNNIPKKDIIARYQNLNSIWPNDDTWHYYTHQKIANTISEWIGQDHNHDHKILNAGSGGTKYGIKNTLTFQADICNKNLPSDFGVQCSIEDLPFPDNTFDMVICVGSVINYCDALVSLSELSRVTKPLGKIIIEFEKSDNFEFLGKKHFCANAAMIETFYAGNNEKVWVYHENYIDNLFALVKLSIKRKKRFHILSAIALLFINDKKATKLAIFDCLFEKIPLLNKFSSNVICQCEKLP